MHHTVYVTTNVQNGKFYIGKHSTRNLKDGYRGSGVWVLRAKNKKRKLFTRTIKFCETEKNAYEYEHEIVSIAKEIWPDLCMNITDGGMGFYSSDTSKRCGVNAPMYGKTLSAEARKKISIKYKETWNGKSPMYGKLHSDEAKKRMSESHMAIGHLRGKKVKCVENGVIYRSLAEASRSVSGGSHGRNNIRKCIYGDIKIAYGFTWEYVEDRK
jgi:hypothetical protein